MLPGEVGGLAIGHIFEGIVLASQVPHWPSATAVDVGQSVGVARGDEVVAMFVFVDAVDVEPVPGVIRRSGISELVEAIIEGEVVGGFPFEHELVRLNVDLLKIAVPDPGDALSAVFG